MQTLVTTIHDHERALQIAQALDLPVVNTVFTRFADGEVKAEIEGNLSSHSSHLIIIQTIERPVNELFFALASLIYDAKKKGVELVTLVAPYCAYAREEGFLASLLSRLGIDRLISCAMHDSAHIYYHALPIDNISVDTLLAYNIVRLPYALDQLCLVAPDKGAQPLVERIAKLTGIADVLVFHKERYDTNQTRITGFSGKAYGKIAIVIDDIIDTGGTAMSVANALHAQGAHEIIGYFVHPVFSGDARERIEESVFSSVFVSDSLPLSSQSSKINRLCLTQELIAFLKPFIPRIMHAHYRTQGNQSYYRIG